VGVDGTFKDGTLAAHVYADSFALVVENETPRVASVAKDNRAAVSTGPQPRSCRWRDDDERLAVDSDLAADVNLVAHANACVNIVQFAARLPRRSSALEHYKRIGRVLGSTARSVFVVGLDPRFELVERYSSSLARESCQIFLELDEMENSIRIERLHISKSDSFPFRRQKCETYTRQAVRRWDSCSAQVG